MLKTKQMCFLRVHILFPPLSLEQSFLVSWTFASKDTIQIVFASNQYHLNWKSHTLMFWRVQSFFGSSTSNVTMFGLA